MVIPKKIHVYPGMVTSAAIVLTLFGTPLKMQKCCQVLSYDAKLNLYHMTDCKVLEPCNVFILYLNECISQFLQINYGSGSSLSFIFLNSIFFDKKDSVKFGG